MPLNLRMHALGLALPFERPRLNLKRLELELGGNSPFVVLHDADIDHVLEAAVFGKFLHQGQICMSLNRFIVDDRVYDAFVERFADRFRAIKIGDPDQPDTVIGPIINEKQPNGLIERIRDARTVGARQVTGGEPEGLVPPATRVCRRRRCFG